MTEIVLASRNRGKIAELKELLGLELTVPFRLLSLDEIGYYGDTEETGKSFEENAFIKAAVPAALGYIGVADDSGLIVDALGGAPGIYSARYSGEDADAARNNEKLLRELERCPEPARTARFFCAVSCVFPDGREPITATGSCEGRILCAPRGEGGFGYDPLFYYPPLDRSFGELSPEEKNRISHRSAAMREFAVKLSLRLK